MDTTFSYEGWLLMISFFSATSYGYWLLGEAERQNRKQRKEQ